MEKGTRGYLNARKYRYLLWAVLEFGIVIAVFALGYVQTGSRLNLLTIVAVVGCLPASKMLVEFITMAPHKGISREHYEEIEEKAPLLIKAYDMLITNTEKVMPVPAMVIWGHTVCGYTESSRTDEAECAAGIREMLKENHYDKMTVKIFRDYKAFLLRAEGMNNIAAVEKRSGKMEHAIRKLILTVSM